MLWKVSTRELKLSRKWVMQQDNALNAIFCVICLTHHIHMQSFSFDLIKGGKFVNNMLYYCNVSELFQAV